METFRGTVSWFGRTELQAESEGRRRDWVVREDEGKRLTGRDEMKDGGCSVRGCVQADNGLTGIFIFNNMSSLAAHLLLCCQSPPGTCVSVCKCEG